MNKGTIGYSADELLPVIADMAENYTSKESTSVPYDKARQFMAAAVYCIRSVSDGTLTNKAYRPSAMEAYRYGYNEVCRRVTRSQQEYNELLEFFYDYGNDNYYETVRSAIAGFFKNYDIKYAPQNTIITMDYPTIIPIRGTSGIDAIQKYVHYIYLEQQFLNMYPRKYVLDQLADYRTDYEGLFINICEYIEWYILGCKLIHKDIYEPIKEADCDYLQKTVLSMSHGKLEGLLSSLLHETLADIAKENMESSVDIEDMYKYMVYGLNDYSARLKLAADNDRIKEDFLKWI